MRTLIDRLPDNLYVKDTQSQFILANQAVSRVMGVTGPDDLIGKSDFDIFPRELAEKYYTDEQELIKSGMPFMDHQEPVLDLHTNSQRWYSTLKIPIRDKNDRISGLVGIGRDITIQKQAEDALQDANKKQSTWIADLERYSRQIALLNELSDLLLTCPTVDEAYSVISDLARQLFPNESGSLYIISASRNLVEIVAKWGVALADPPVLEPEDCWSLRLGRMHIVEAEQNKVNNNSISSGLICGHIQDPLPQAYICVPLVAQGEAIGFLHIRRLPDAGGTSSDDSETEWFTQEKQQFAHSVAYSLALALANLKLRETLRQQSIRDQLTGMFNRRYMEESLEREIRRLSRVERPLGVIMLDIDHFKQFNDTYGHDAGDTVLRELGIYLRSQVRVEDIPCRYGGEEFALILPDTTVEITKLRAEKLREGVKHLNLQYNGQGLGTVTVSVGISICPDHGFTGDAVIHSADNALYHAKQTGRDKVVVAETY